jgi:hypothetical protein
MAKKKGTNDLATDIGGNMPENASHVNSAKPANSITLISREDFHQKIKALQNMAWIRNDRHQDVPFGGTVKEHFIRLCQQGYPMVAHDPKHLIELGSLLSEADDLLRPQKLFGKWLNFVGLLRQDAEAYIRVYKRFGADLHRFAHFGLKKLLTLSQLRGCLEYMERHEETISALRDDELELVVTALNSQYSFFGRRSGRQKPRRMKDGQCTERSEPHSTGLTVQL